MSLEGSPSIFKNLEREVTFSNTFLECPQLWTNFWMNQVWLITSVVRPSEMAQQLAEATHSASMCN